MSKLILQDTPVAGITFSSLAENWKDVIPQEIIEDQNKATELQVKLEKEPGNPYDPHAVAIYLNGKHVGYVPRTLNKKLSIYTTDQLEARLTDLLITRDIRSMRLDVYVKDDCDYCGDEISSDEEDQDEDGEDLDDDQDDVGTDSMAGMPELHQAAANKDMAKITELVNAGTDVNLLNESGESAIFYANNANTASSLISHGANVNLLDADGCNPLHWAARYDHRFTDYEWTPEERVAFYIYNGCDVNLVDNDGMTPVQEALNSEQDMVLSLLIAHHADLAHRTAQEDSYLHLVSNARQAKKLYDAGCQVGWLNDAGESPLHTAIKGEIAKEMIQRGESIDQRDDQGWTPIHDAASWGQFDKVKVLILAGSALHWKDYTGQLPIDLAQEYLVKLQADKDADPDEVIETMATISVLQNPLAVFAAEDGKRPKRSRKDECELI